MSLIISIQANVYFVENAALTNLCRKFVNICRKFLLMDNKSVYVSYQKGYCLQTPRYKPGNCLRLQWEKQKNLIILRVIISSDEFFAEHVIEVDDG